MSFEKNQSCLSERNAYLCASYNFLFEPIVLLIIYQKGRFLRMLEIKSKTCCADSVLRQFFQLSKGIT